MRLCQEFLRGSGENIPRPGSSEAPPAVSGHHLPHLVEMAGEVLLWELGKTLQREQARQEPREEGWRAETRSRIGGCWVCNVIGTVPLQVGTATYPQCQLIHQNVSRREVSRPLHETNYRISMLAGCRRWDRAGLFTDNG